MRAVVLAAGKGTRLFPLTGDVPKPLAPVADTPIIEHSSDLLALNAIEEAYVNVHYLADTLLEAYDGEASYINGMSVHLLSEKELTDTAGGVKHLAKIASKGSFNETFVVVSGDALTDIDLKALLAFYKQKGALATIALTIAIKRVYDTSKFRVVEFDEEGNFLSYQEKPTQEKP